MTVTYVDFIEFAENLPNDSEINNRNAASRSYYSAFHKCIEKYNGCFGSDGGIHQNIIEHLYKSKDKAEKSIGYQMVHIKNYRVAADYHLDEDFTKSKREEAFIYTNRIINKLDSF